MAESRTVSACVMPKYSVFVRFASLIIFSSYISWSSNCLILRPSVMAVQSISLKYSIVKIRKPSGEHAESSKVCGAGVLTMTSP